MFSLSIVEELTSNTGCYAATVGYSQVEVGKLFNGFHHTLGCPDSIWIIMDRITKQPISYQSKLCIRSST